MESFNDVYSRMMENYRNLTGYTPSEESDVAIRIRLLAGEIVACQMNLDFLKNQAFIETATGEYLDYHGGLRGLTRKSSIKAKGEVTFTLAEELTYQVVIPKGTLIASLGADAVTFETDAQAIINTGQTSVTVACTALQGGRKGNVKAGTVNVMVDTVSDVSAVNNKNNFTGGADTESDQSFRRRITDSVINVSNGTNQAYYKKLAESVDGVSSAGVIPLGRGAGTVDVYICSYGEEASDELIAKVQSLMDEKREINSDVKVYSAKPYGIIFNLSIDIKTGYDFDTVAEQCRQAIRDYVYSLKVGDYFRSADYCDKIYHIDGVLNYDSLDSDVYTPQSSFITVRDIEITRGDGK